MVVKQHSADALPSLFTVDVEDWFHILDLEGAPGLSEWDSQPSRVEANFLRMLDILDAHQVKVTCFVLGWVAERYPHLVTTAAARGHEIASHGYAHRLVYQMGEKAFFDDALKAKRLLEDLSGTPVLGYRAAGFSVTTECPWFFERLAEAGYTYDSSVFPAKRAHGGMDTGRFAPYRVETAFGAVTEFPITVAPVFGKPVCFFGGGYLRLFPHWLIRTMSQRVRRDGRPVMYYVHPREIDNGQPRLPMGPVRKFKSYYNIAGTEAKMHALLGAGSFLPVRDYLTTHFHA
jgi:polysaccharide deacetylase family protein (PEP-CTERM system associated)